MGANVFLSFAKADRDLAQRVAQSLADNGIHADFADDLPNGSKFAESLRSNLERSDVAVFIASDASLGSAYVMAELGAAQALNKRIVAIQPDGAATQPASSPFSVVQTLDAGHLSPDQIATTIRAQLAKTPA